MYKFASFLLIAVASFIPAVAADGAAPPSKAEVEAFRLSMDKVNATARAFENLFDLVASDPKLMEQWKQEGEKEGGDSDSSLSATCERLGRSDKRIPAAFTKAGITPKEADMTMQTIAGGMLGLAMAESAGVKDLKLQNGMAKDNIEFLQAHKAEIMQVLEKIKTLQAKYEGMSEEEK
jgi:hypothetical protein